ncbi:putative bifunctional diguanylate cyclase/phosphodiesterase [Pseudonocardia humida]|uniref:Bifunctional diguanylate cyclase/phosphodiesterase n=1 Tax=Pseudonocardia humida TaxID=2800819 RepID=A0ABT0ZSA2_9PSEU|nr:EAL domain-containing protein [Pseudonocardia humida]MCO1653602.1 bifunctional diguanylate cyclase/phosphodiesterase [Pseudonocardia humida]
MGLDGSPDDGPTAACARPVGPARVWAALRRPRGLVEQARWLFTLSAVLSLLSTLPKPVLTMDPDGLAVVAVAVVVLIGAWVRRYRTRHDALPLDVLEAGALTAIAAVFPNPTAVWIFTFAAVWLRALYGTALRAVLYCALVPAGVLAAVPLWADLYGGDAAAEALSMALPIPALCFTMLVARSLARSLFARDQAQQRDAALVELGRRLIGPTDGVAIDREARRVVTAICAATPGLCAMLMRGEPGGLRVLARSGPCGEEAGLLPRSVLPAGVALNEVAPCADDAAMARLVGFAGQWLFMPVAGGPDRWFAMGSADRVPGDAVVAVRSVGNQIALALRTSEAHRDLTAQALVDPLTGLANRSAFTAALAAQRDAPDRRFALLFLDLDDFKVVNDGLGHAAGDELLRHVATRLGRAVRPQDLCARLGGDEFAVLLPDSDDTALAVAQQLVRLLAAPVSVNGRLVHVGVSIGLAFATAGVSPDELLRHADAAMYAAKAAGKNRVRVFDAGLLGDDDRADFEAELAAAADAGQLEVHYQPIVSVSRGHPVAVEALVRWRHPTRGLLPPGEFVPAAERSGAIVGIGAHVLRRACAEAAGWSGPGGPLALHVNVSAAQLTEAPFLDAVRSCIADFALAPGRLVLEVTESMVLDSPAIEDALDRLIELGAAIAIDDFGTGYSALSTLRTLPLDIVKIDRSFLAGCPGRAADEAVVEAIIEVAGRLGLTVVAEGVERVEQQGFLRAVGAHAAQGYLHLRPAPAEEFARWLHGCSGNGAVELLHPPVRAAVRGAGGRWGTVAPPPAPRRTG